MRRGFTLVEVVVVLLVLGIASAVTMPHWLNESDQSLQRASDAGVALLMDLRLRAARQADAMELTLDPRTGHYWISDGRLRVITSDTLELPEGVRIAAQHQRLHFRFERPGTGPRSTGDTLRFTSNGVTRSLSLDQWTGAIHAW